ncbi:MAG: heme-binding protein [Albidovulum sp.]
MVNKSRLEEYRKSGRQLEVATPGDEDLGPLKLLPGVWKNTDAFNGRGWNMIALPFARADNPFNYRLLVNQYNEELKFNLVDKAVPNRGIAKGAGTNTDQFVVTLDFEQTVRQLKAEDEPDSGLAGAADLPIHHEPGLWLHMTNERTDNLDIARLSTVPHGDSVLALGESEVIDGPPTIQPINGLPIGVSQNLDNNPYLRPYKHYNDNPFKGIITDPFPGFNPVSPEGLLALGIPGNVVRTTILKVSTTVNSGGIHNIPFVVKQANAAQMESIFYVMELTDKDKNGDPKLVLAYSQVVMLDFFPRRDGMPGLIGWPHVSINTMEKVPDPEKYQELMQTA